MWNRFSVSNAINKGDALFISGLYHDARRQYEKALFRVDLFGSKKSKGVIYLRKALLSHVEQHDLGNFTSNVMSALEANDSLLRSDLEVTAKQLNVDIDEAILQKFHEAELQYYLTQKAKIQVNTTVIHIQTDLVKRAEKEGLAYIDVMGNRKSVFGRDAISATVWKQPYGTRIVLDFNKFYVGGKPCLSVSIKGIPVKWNYSSNSVGHFYQHNSHANPTEDILTGENIRYLVTSTQVKDRLTEEIQDIRKELVGNLLSYFNRQTDVAHLELNLVKYYPVLWATHVRSDWTPPVHRTTYRTHCWRYVVSASSHSKTSMSETPGKSEDDYEITFNIVDPSNML